jgi:hypothetical protein
MGSLVLSRSFHVEADPRKTTQNKTDGDGLEDVAMNSGSDHDDACDDNDDDEQDDGEELDREAVDDIAMVPLADLLNAKTGCENVFLPLPIPHRSPPPLFFFFFFLFLVRVTLQKKNETPLLGLISLGST